MAVKVVGASCEDVNGNDGRKEKLKLKLWCFDRGSIAPTRKLQPLVADMSATPTRPLAISRESARSI